mgnify:CR=1 FL=1
MKRIHIVKSIIHAIGVRSYAAFYDIKSKSGRRNDEPLIADDGAEEMFWCFSRLGTGEIKAKRIVR